jgi:hypothetical protein
MGGRLSWYFVNVKVILWGRKKINLSLDLELTVRLNMVLQEKNEWA